MENRSLFLLAILVLIGAAMQLRADELDRHFAVRVLPLLKSKCFACHGNDADKIEGEYEMTTRAGLLAGGESGEAALVPGKPDESKLLSAIRWEELEMPPKENDRLTKEQVEIVRDWIAAGAPWPSGEDIARYQKEDLESDSGDGVRIATSGGTSHEWTNRRYKPEDVWAFGPLKRPAVPDAAEHPIDAFVRAKLNEANLKPAPKAAPRTLIRRATYDLLGLPPTPKEVDEFLDAWDRNSKQAWSDLIDRLLASEHYGERWAQHWLDVARYADTAGFSNDYERSNAWRYRDYVIRSLNNDKPYDEFVIEQIAGDELRPVDPEMKVATGFLRMGPWGTAMIKKPQARQIYLDDVVHGVGQTFLSMPMRCCKCHDHKFDPVPTRDYYRMYAAFAATQPAEMPAKFLDAENRNRFDEGKAHVEKLLAYAQSETKKLTDKREAAARKWYEENNLPYKDNNARKNDPDDQKPPRHVGLDYVDEGTLKVREQDVWIWTRRLERYQPLAQSVYNGSIPNYINARKLRRPGKLNENWRPENFIYSGGALEAAGDPVTPGVLSGTGLGVPGAPSDDPFAVTENLDGRRLALARWIADEKNPLTARSIVNRIWQHHFGKGIVATPNNFGVKGAKPTHPELLDWLATDFIAGEWKMKRLHRLIMMSDVYQQATHHPDLKKLETVDPDNKLLARRLPRGLTAEELRDSMLAISGELNRELGGLPVMPEINLEVALEPRMIQFSLAPAYQPSPTPKERDRRSIYAYRVRGQADPLMEVLNLPNPNDSCEARPVAATTPQAFTLFNSDVTTDRSIAFAQRLQNEGDDVAAQVVRAFRLALGREAAGGEVERLTEYVRKMRDYHRKHAPEKIEYPTQLTRSLVEELSGKPFEYTEILPIYEEYQADAKAWTVNADTRALADLCLLLLNSNEFIYVY